MDSEARLNLNLILPPLCIPAILRNSSTVDMHHMFAAVNQTLMESHL